MANEAHEENKATEVAGLPKEEHAHHIRVQDLAKLLVKKAVISEDEFEWLVIKGYMIPRLESATEETGWETMKDLKRFMGLPVEE